MYYGYALLLCTYFGNKVASNYIYLKANGTQVLRQPIKINTLKEVLLLTFALKQSTNGIYILGNVQSGYVITNKFRILFPF